MNIKARFVPSKYIPLIQKKDISFNLLSSGQHSFVVGGRNVLGHMTTMLLKKPEIERNSVFYRWLEIKVVYWGTRHNVPRSLRQRVGEGYFLDNDVRTGSNTFSASSNVEKGEGRHAEKQKHHRSGER